VCRPALGVCGDGCALGRVETIEGPEEIGADIPAVRHGGDLVETVRQRSGAHIRLLGLGQGIPEGERPPRAPPAVVDRLVARDDGGSGADEIERQGNVGGGRTEQRQDDVGADVVAILGFDAGTAQLRIDGPAHALARDRNARIAGQHARRGAQADAEPGIEHVPNSLKMAR
jgi:hypothetical protein